MHRVVVTGIGVVSPNGIGRREFGEAIVEGRSGVSLIESFDTSGQAIKIAGEVKNFDVTPYLGEHKKNAKLMSRAVGFAVGAAALAVEDAGLETDKLDPARFGVCMGTGITPVDVERAGRADRQGIWASDGDVRHGAVRAGPGRVDLPALALEAPAEHGGGAHLDPAPRDGAEQHDRDGLRGGDPGGRRGVPPDRPGRRRRDAGRRLRQPARPAAPGRLQRDEGRQRVAPAARRGLAPVRRRARRLRAGRGGRGADAGEPAARQAARATIYAEITGYGSSFDAYGITRPEPEGKGAALSMTAALREAKVDPADIDYINAHGTSTRLNDLMETVAVKRVFGHRARLDPDELAEVDGRPPDRRLGRLGGRGDRACRSSAGSSRPRSTRPPPTRPATSTTSPTPPARCRCTTAISNSFGFGGQNASLVMAHY